MLGQLWSDRDRLLSVAAVCLCVAVVGMVATGLESSYSSKVVSTPEQSPTSELSLIALLYLLLNSILSLVGITLEMNGGRASNGSMLRLVLNILQDIWQHRVALLIITISLLVLLLGARHRGQISSIERRLSNIEPRERSLDQSANAWSERDPSNSVAQAWLKMVQQIDTDNPRAQTPGEWQTTAIEAGFNPKAVRTITDTFIEVQYGNAAVTSTRQTSVQNAVLELSKTNRDDER